MLSSPPHTLTEPLPLIGDDRVRSATDTPKSFPVSKRRKITKTVKKDPAFSFWKRKAARPLTVLLEKADYDPATQGQYIDFFLHHIIPALGPPPSSSSTQQPWKSFMTDDHTPVELSWDWNTPGERPEIRYSIEPIGALAGTPVDPFNMHATRCLIEQLKQTVPGIDLRWYEHFAAYLLPAKNQGPALIPTTSDHASSQSTTFLAFDLSRTGAMTVKAYFLPSTLATASRISNFTLITQAIRSLPENGDNEFKALNTVAEFITTDPVGKKLECDILSIDCVDPAEARVKIYFRSRETSFESVRRIMGLGGRISTERTEKAMEELFELWKGLFGCSDTSMTQSMELRQCQHRTAGILYYFDLSKNKSVPVPKVYLPVRHYADSDYQVARAVCAVLGKTGAREVQVERYLEAVGEIL
ncbi:MAG: hypothetical protein Q9170_003851 [Blastenia crenularia]